MSRTQHILPNLTLTTTLFFSPMDKPRNLTKVWKLLICSIRESGFRPITIKILHWWWHNPTTRTSKKYQQRAVCTSKSIHSKTQARERKTWKYLDSLSTCFYQQTLEGWSVNLHDLTYKSKGKIHLRQLQQFTGKCLVTF